MKKPLLISAVAAALASIAVAILLSGSSTAQNLDLVGVSAEELRAGGIVLERPTPDDSPRIDAEHASDAASDQHEPGATVREVVLARMGDDLGLRDKQLVWVVSFEPDSVMPIPPLGPGPASSPVDLKTLEVVLALVFVDADTGEIVHSLQQTQGSPLVD